MQSLGFTDEGDHSGHWHVQSSQWTSHSVGCHGGNWSALWIDIASIGRGPVPEVLDTGLAPSKGDWGGHWHVQSSQWTSCPIGCHGGNWGALQVGIAPVVQGHMVCDFMCKSCWNYLIALYGPTLVCTCIHIYMYVNICTIYMA